jgi:hypothetical protein
MRRALQILLFILSGLLFIAGIVLVVREYVLIPGEYVEPEIVVTPAPAVSAAPSLTPAPTATGTPAPTVTPVLPTPEAQLTAPVKIYFPERKIMMEIQPVGRVEEGKKKGQMDTVDSATIAAWYEPGPIPGEKGNAIINGHVRYGGVKGYFSILPELELRERVIIEHEDGAFTVFVVRSVEVYPYNKVPSSVMELESEKPMLTLITCHGEFQQDVGTSEERCVVICEPED